MAISDRNLVEEMHRLASFETEYVDMLSKPSKEQDRFLLENLAALTSDVEQIREEQVAVLMAATDTGDVETMLKVDRAIVINQFTNLDQGDQMRNSLTNTLLDVHTALDTLDELLHPSGYYRDRYDKKLANNPRNRSGGLPKDQVRQYFTAQETRLRNMATAPMSDSARKLLKARVRCLRTAKDVYIQLQRDALAPDDRQVREPQMQWRAYRGGVPASERPATGWH